MLVTWKETQNWCGQLVSARNSLQLVLAIRGATQGKKPEFSARKSEIIFRNSDEEKQAGAAHGRYMEMSQAKKWN